MEGKKNVLHVGLVLAGPLSSLMPDTTLNDSIASVEYSCCLFDGLHVVKVCA